MDLRALNSPNLEGLHGFSEIRTPNHPPSRFGNLFCVFCQAIGEFQFLVSVIPASYGGNSSVQGRFCRQAIGISHLEGLVVATSYWEIHIRGLAAGDFHFGRF